MHVLDVPFFAVPFFEQKINFWGIISSKIASIHKFSGVISVKITL